MEKMFENGQILNVITNSGDFYEEQHIKILEFLENDKRYGPTYIVLLEKPDPRTISNYSFEEAMISSWSLDKAIQENRIEVHKTTNSILNYLDENKIQKALEKFKKLL